MTNVKRGWDDGVLFYPLRRGKIGIALEEDARTVDPHVISTKTWDTPIFLSVDGYRTLSDPDPFLRSRQPRHFRVVAIPS